MAKYKRFVRMVLHCFLLIGVLVPWPVTAATTSQATTASNSSLNAVTVGYATDTPLQNGTIVRLDSRDAGKVQPDTADTAKAMHGVVVAANDATVTLSDGSVPPRQVYVATVGRYDVLVSTQNGPIHTGDYITISALAGIGMKADSAQPVVLGKAAADFTGAGNVEGTATLKSSQGKTVAVSLGRIPVDLGVNHNPLAGGSTGVPGFLNNAASIVSDKPVAPVRLYLSLFIFIVTAAIASGLLYSGVRSSMVAIGRNPLAKNRISLNLLRVVATSVIVFVIGLLAVYLLLKL